MYYGEQGKSELKEMAIRLRWAVEACKDCAKALVAVAESFEKIEAAACQITNNALSIARAAAVEQEETHPGDCWGCWCDTCANVGKCINEPPTHWKLCDSPRIIPWPCGQCEAGQRYMPILEGEDNCTCAGYAEAAPDTE